jgi:hypothetical protein
VETIIRAASKEGRKVMSVITRPGGVTEILFAEGDGHQRVTGNAATV